MSSKMISSSRCCSISTPVANSELVTVTMIASARIRRERRVTLYMADDPPERPACVSGRRQPVTGAVNGVQQLAREGFVDHRAQAVDVAAQDVAVGEGVSPDVLFQFLARHHAVGVEHEKFQQLALDGIELQAPAGAVRFQGVAV